MAYTKEYADYLNELAKLPSNTLGFTISREQFGRLNYYTIWRGEYVGWYRELDNINDAVSALKQQCRPDNDSCNFIRPSWWTDEYERLYVGR